MSYQPTVGPDRAAQIRAWHDAAYKAMREEAGRDGQRFSYLGLTLGVPPEVQPITGMSHLLGEAVIGEVKPGEAVLDMGTGSGVNALLAARNGARVVAVDVNPVAVEATRANAVTNGVAERVDVRHSDLFDAVPESFDLVVFDPPFRWFQPHDLLEANITDFEYRTLTKFFAEVTAHLNAGARLLMSFGTSGDLGYFEMLAVNAHFDTQIVASQALERDGQRVEYFAFRLAPLQQQRAARRG